MKYVLSDYDSSILVDWHVEAAKKNPADEKNNFTHPITYGDTTIGPDGKEIPREIQLTCKPDQSSKMCLDYVL
jgi:spermidine/putrescine-binding protein